LPGWRSQPLQRLQEVVESPLCRIALAVGLVIATALALAYALTGDWTGQDLDVYRAGGSAILHGHRLYDSSFRTPTQLLFTYPPFSAAIFVPLALLPQTVAVAAWTLCIIVAAGVLVVISMRAALNISVPRRWLFQAVIFGGMIATSLAPVQDCMQEGQVGVFLALMCVADVALLRARWRRGVLIGFAAALKMTPALFIVYFAINRDWKAMRTSVITLAVCWGCAAIAFPRDSFAYFVGGAGFDSSRVGDSSDHLNESLNGLWHRVPVPAPTLLWLASAAIVAFFGLWRAKRASEHGNHLAAAVIVGLVSVLVAPVSWLHHVAWVSPAIVVLACNARHRFASIGAAIAVTALLLVPVGYFARSHVDAHGPGVETYIALILGLVAFLPFGAVRKRHRLGITNQ
jgi:alpha-1,2-mannosyltransferase